jgi:hypothetical protein
MFSTRPAIIVGPPIDSPFRDPSVCYIRPTPGLIAELFWKLACPGLVHDVQPPGLAARTFTRDFRRPAIIDKMVARKAWATAGVVLTRDGWPVGYEAYPGSLSHESRVEMELFPLFGLNAWIDRNSWRSPGRGYRVRIGFVNPPGREVESVNQVLAGMGFDPDRW